MTRFSYISVWFRQKYLIKERAFKNETEWTSGKLSCISVFSQF